MSLKKIHYIFVPFILVLVGCSDCAEDDSCKMSLDDDLHSLIKTHNLKADPTQGLTLPSINDDKAQLGMKLFFSKALGGAKDSACVTCHHPVLGGGDNLSLPIGIESIDPDQLGEGRTYDPSGIYYDHGDALVPRNAPSTYNIALWKRALFWDGRVENVLQNGKVVGIRTPDSAFDTPDPKAGANLAVAQARFPVTSRDEMRSNFEENSSNDRFVPISHSDSVIAMRWII